MFRPGRRRVPVPIPATENPADIIRRDDHLERELETRIQSRRLSAVQSIFPRISKAKHGWTNPNGESFLHVALAHYQSDVFDWLYERLENNPVILSVDKNNRSLVWMAIKRRNLDLAASLLHHQLTSEKFSDSPDRNAWLKSDKHGVSLLHLAAQESSTEFMDFLLPILEDRDPVMAMIHQQDAEEKSPLHYACEAKSYDNILLLINRDADLYLADKNQNNFFTWIEKDTGAEDEKQKIALFKRLDQEKQLRILSYFRGRSEHGLTNPVYLKLQTEIDATLFQPDLNTALDQFEQRQVKKPSQLLDEDRYAINQLIKTADDRMTQFSSRPAPAFDSFFYRIGAKVCRTLALSSLGSFCLFFLGTATEGAAPIFLLSLFGITAASPFVLAGVAMLVLGVCLALAITFFIIANKLDKKTTPPVLQISHEEISDISDSLHTNVVKKCNDLKKAQGNSALPIPEPKFQQLARFITFAKGAPSFAVNSVLGQLRMLKINLVVLLNEMTKTKKPISMVPLKVQAPAPVPSAAAALVSLPASAPEPDASAQTPDVATSANWATLHSSKKTIAIMDDDNVDISDLEMAASAFGKQQ